MSTSCLVSLLTPPGRGAVATVAVCGTDAVKRVAARFAAAAGRPLERLPASRILFGRWRADEGPGEELVVCHRENRVEIHCHGGETAWQAIIETLARDGCRCVAWEELVPCTLDPIAVEAHLALARAGTERTASILLDQLRGSLRSSLDMIASLLEQGRDTKAAEAMDELLGRARLGRHLTDPFRVVLCGQPNVGKSSLTNALLGYRRSIVFDQPGTTRDVVTAHTAIDGWPVELCDTAGLCAAGDAVESMGVELALKKLAMADLVVLVFDASRPRDEEEQQLVTDLAGALVVNNKCDLLAPAEFQKLSLWTTSAVTGQGVPELLTAIAQRLVPETIRPGIGVPFTDRQLDLLQRSRTALEQKDIRRCKEILREDQ